MKRLLLSGGVFIVGAMVPQYTTRKGVGMVQGLNVGTRVFQVSLASVRTCGGLAAVSRYRQLPGLQVGPTDETPLLDQPGQRSWLVYSGSSPDTREADGVVFATLKPGTVALLHEETGGGNVRTTVLECVAA